MSDIKRSLFYTLFVTLVGCAPQSSETDNPNLSAGLEPGTTVTLAVPMNAMVNQHDVFSPDTGGSTPSWYQTTTSEQGSLWFPLGDLVPGSTIEGASMMWSGGEATGAIHDAIPAVLPFLELRRVELLGGSHLVAHVADAPSSAEGYDTNHQVVLSSGVPVETDSTYYLHVRGETGAGARDLAASLNGLFVTIATP